MTQPEESASDDAVPTTAKVVIISSVMFVFISYWRVAAVVLCDLASTAFYIGGIVEHSIGPAAPWFILGVMLFSYAVRSVYIESCSMFVRGGVYRIVKEALGRTTAKLAVAALLFDYVLTGPISGVSAGQYLMSLFFEILSHSSGMTISPEARDFWKSAGSVVIACCVTIYFFRLNVIGIHESSDKALKIMIVTTIMGATILGWSIVTLAIEGPRNPVVFAPTFTPKANPATNQMESPLGFLEGTSFAERLTDGWHWWSMIGVIGFFIAFGHSVLAMSGEETLAQIYREVESPKLKNFKKAAFIVFVYSLLLTGGISVLAVLLIPDAIRMDKYGDNLIAGLAMNVYGPPIAKLALNAFVVSVGSLILAGAVNTAIIGSNGVLNRVAEDGVIPDWFVKPHPRFGTTYRLLYVILGLQLFTIVVSHGDVLLLGEAYAFGVVWSFVFNCLAMLILRFRDPNRPRGFKVPLNLKVGTVELPIGLSLIFLILLVSAITNVLTKEIATVAGACFTVALFAFFSGTEYFRRRQAGTQDDEHLDEFNELVTDSITPDALNLKHHFRRVVSLRSPNHLEPLDKALAETDPETTDVVTMIANVRPVGGIHSEHVPIGIYERQLMNAIEKRAEEAGKTVVPIVVSTNNALHAIMQTVQTVGAQELFLALSERYTPNEQLDRCAFHWSQLHGGNPTSLTIRIIGQNRDFVADIGGGNRIPETATDEVALPDHPTAKDTNRVLLVLDGTPQSSELFHRLLAMLDPNVAISVIQMVADDHDSQFPAEAKKAQDSGRILKIEDHTGQAGSPEEIVKIVREEKIDLVIAATSPANTPTGKNGSMESWSDKVQTDTDCRVLMAAAIPQLNSPKG